MQIRIRKSEFMAAAGRLGSRAAGRQVAAGRQQGGRQAAAGRQQGGREATAGRQ
jgi:hypothetical protein